MVCILFQNVSLCTNMHSRIKKKKEGERERGIKEESEKEVSK